MVTETDAKAISQRVGETMRGFAASIVAPIYWASRDADDSVIARNGTAFFLRTSAALFGVTAAHVIEGKKGWRQHCLKHGKTALRLAGKHGTSVPFDWDARCIDIDLQMDIATFTVSLREMEQINRVPYEGLQPDWPQPDRDAGVAYAGFPGVETNVQSHAAVEFGLFFGSGLVSGINNFHVSSLLERDCVQPLDGEGMVPDNYDFGGISGSPLIYFLTKGGLFANALAGVILSGPNPSTNPDESIPGFELFQARRAHFISADGALDRALWDSIQPP